MIASAPIASAPIAASPVGGAKFLAVGPLSSGQIVACAQSVAGYVSAIGPLSVGALFCDTITPDGQIAAIGPLASAQITADTDVPESRILATGPLASADILARTQQAGAWSAIGPLGSGAILTRCQPPEAAAIPSGITYYHCMLTGAPDGLADTVLPITSFSVRHRESTASYYQITIPTLAYVDALTDRPNGQIVIWSDTDGITEELMRGSLGIPRTDRGPNSQAISISGNASRAATPRQTYIITDVLYQYSTFDGEQRLRIRPRAGIRPGDTIRYGSTYFIAGMVSWSVSVSANGMTAQMEVATLAEEYLTPDPEPDPDPPFSFIEAGSASLDEYVQYSALVPAGAWEIQLTNLTADLDLYADFTAFVEDNAQFGSWLTDLADENIALTLAEQTTVYIAVHGYRAGSYTLTIVPA